MTCETAISSGIFLTDKAANKLNELRHQENGQQLALRFADKRGFCGAGFEYTIQLTSFPQPEDKVFYSHGIEIYVPSSSMERLSGCTIDYKKAAANEQFDDLQKIGFIAENPHVKGPCPCGCTKGFDF